MGEKSIWHSTLLLGAFSLSVANLNLLPAWRTLIFANTSDLYFIPRPMRHDYIGALLLLLALAGSVFLFSKAVMSRDSDGTKWKMLAVMVICLVNPLDFLRHSLPASVSLVASLFYLGTLFVMASVLLWKWHRFLVSALYLFLVLLSPFALSNSAQAVWWAIRIDEGNGHVKENAQFVGRERVDRGDADLQRVMWIIFDELDQRVLFEDRPAGYDFTAFDSFRAQSIYAPRVIPPAGNTSIGMPTYLIGHRVVNITKSMNRLEVQIDGSHDFVAINDFDHLFAEASASGASTGIAGFYHPYCRLFGEFVDRCVGFHIGVWHRSSENLPSTMRSLTRALVPGWQRGNYIRTFNGIRSAALEMAVNPDRDFVMVHVNVPHPPPIYDPESGELKIWGFGLSYADNVICADDMLGAIERESRKAGLWNETAVVVTSDHGWRSLGGESELGAIPLLIKMADQSEEIRLEQEFDSVLTKALLVAILKRELRTPHDVVSWMLSQRGDKRGGS